MDKWICLFLICTFALDQISDINIYHKVAIEYPEVIEGRCYLIYTDVLETKDESEGDLVDDYGASLNEEDVHGL